MACWLANRLISLASQLAASLANGMGEVGCSKEELASVASINSLEALTVRVIYSVTPCNETFNILARR